MSSNSAKPDIIRSIECEIVDQAGLPCIFLHNPKTAGTSLRNLLGMQGQVKHIVAESVPDEIWQNRTSIVSVRHPISRFFSLYRYHVLSDYDGILAHKIKGLKNFSASDYFSNIKEQPTSSHWCLQSNFVFKESVEKPHCDVILRFEQVSQWRRILSKSLNTNLTDLVRLNSTKKNELDFWQDTKVPLKKRDSLVENLIEHYHLDFSALGYPSSISW